MKSVIAPLPKWTQGRRQAGPARRRAPARARRGGTGRTRWPRPATPRARRALGAGPLAGRKLLAAMFGNSPFLTGVAVREWAFLTRLVEDGADAAFDAVIAETTNPPDGETQAELMRRLRIARRRARAYRRGRRHRRRLGPRTPDAGADRVRRGGARRGDRSFAAQGRRGQASPKPRRPHPKRAVSSSSAWASSAAANSITRAISTSSCSTTRHGLRRSARDALHSLCNRLARELVRILDERTGDGYVFRTDLRLRPDPRSTPLVMSVDAALSYYETAGQNWERAALIKARPVAGDRAAGRALSRRAASLISGASISTSRRLPTSIRSSVRSRRIAAAGESPLTDTTSRSAAAASARSSSSRRRSS